MRQGSHIINGKQIAKRICTEISSLIETNLSRLHRRPSLAVVLVGSREDSTVYVRMKQRAAEEVGIMFQLLHYHEDVSEETVKNKVKRLNADDSIDGIIIQLPLPGHFDEIELLHCVDYHKDVDGFHAMNNVISGVSRYPPCTVRGVLKLLAFALSGGQSIDETSIVLNGQIVCVVGSGNVGKPLSVMLMQRGATVVCCNKDTPDIPSLCCKADIVVSATGCAGLVTKDWIKPGAVVIDVGISRLPNGKLSGDVAFDEVAEIASYITPVPGGVGPMTVAMLMMATAESWLSKVTDPC